MLIVICNHQWWKHQSFFEEKNIVVRQESEQLCPGHHFMLQRLLNFSKLHFSLFSFLLLSFSCVQAFHSVEWNNCVHFLDSSSFFFFFFSSALFYWWVDGQVNLLYHQPCDREENGCLFTNSLSSYVFMWVCVCVCVGMNRCNLVHSMHERKWKVFEPCQW